jgi:exodeoxyribonuclease-1
MKNYAIIDIESQGASTSYSSIISIAGILVNPELQELDRFELYARNKPGFVCDPYSLWLNQGFDRMKNSNLSHFEMMKQLHQYINKWNPVVWTGWNSIGFDFIMLQKENAKSLLPIYITNTNGSEHSDYLPVARASKLFFPECLKTAFSAKNNPIFKLDSIGPLNFPDSDATKYHTAIQDCEILLRVMKKLKEKANQIFELSKLTTSKFSAKEKIETERVFTTCFYFYGKMRPFCTTYLTNHGAFKNWPMLFCLENDPKDLMKLDYNSLKESLRKPGKWVRACPLKHPIILPAKFALQTEPYKSIGMPLLLERANLVHGNKEFAKKVSLALGEIAVEKKREKDNKNNHLLSHEDSIYAKGFPSPEDQETMKSFHEANDWAKKNEIISKIKDERFIYFGKRLIYQNSPKSLNPKEYKEIYSDIAKKILSTEETRWTTIPMAESLIDNIRNEKDISDAKLSYMNKIDEYLQQMRTFYEKAS